MPRPVRQFEPQITRSGGAPSKYRFTARCSECLKTDSYEANQSVSDDVIKGYFKERGWLLGRDRSYDVCLACLAGQRDTDRHRGTETPRRGFAGTARQPDREAASVNARHKDTADILARHLGKPETLASEVFRPRAPQAPRPTASDVTQPSVSAPALSPEVEQALTGMAADLKGLRSTMELMAEQMSKLVALGSQQIETIARLAPLMIQSTDRISGEFKDLKSATRANSGPSGVGLPQQPSPAVEPPTEQVQEVSSEPRSEWASQPIVQAKQTRRPRTNGSPGRQSAADHAVVKSLVDAKRPNRFYTTVRLPRELWDRSGFGPEDRIQIDWKKKALFISRVSDGGVKPKTVGDAIVVLQSWRLGDLNFDPARITSGDGLMRLTPP